MRVFTSLILESQGHRKFQRAIRLFFDENVYEDAQSREEDGKRPSQAVFDKMAYVLSFLLLVIAVSVLMASA